MSRLYTSAAALLLIILVFISGCVHSEIETSLFAAKINSEGKLVWVQLIDSDENDVGINFTERSDGSYLIQGGSFTPVCGSSSSHYIRPYKIFLSPQGKIQSIEKTSEAMTYEYRFGSFTRGVSNDTSLSTFTSDGGSHLTAYQMAKLGARSFRLQKMNGEGKILWDVPFLTLKDTPPPKDIWDGIFIQGIFQASDKGYIVWGHYEKSTSC